jgi:hypothetical protein
MAVRNNKYLESWVAFAALCSAKQRKLKRETSVAPPAAPGTRRRAFMPRDTPNRCGKIRV